MPNDMPVAYRHHFHPPVIWANDARRIGGNTFEIRLACMDETKFFIINEVHRASKQTHADLIDIDGVRVNCLSGWWLHRASNTQPALAMWGQAHDEASLSRLKNGLAGVSSKVGVDAAPLFEAPS